MDLDTVLWALLVCAGAAWVLLGEVERNGMASKAKKAAARKGGKSRPSVRRGMARAKAKRRGY